MSNRYPRRAALAGQQSKPGPKYRPSNDNLPGRRGPLKMPGPPLPANDNIPGRLPKAPAGIPPAVWRRMVPGLLARGLPLIGWAWTAWELYNLYDDWVSSRYNAPPYGWTQSQAWDAYAWWDPGAEYAGPYRWSYSGYIGGYAIRTTETGAPPEVDEPLTSPHYWWHNIAFSIPEDYAHIAVQSRWERDYNVPDEYQLPPRPVFIPYWHPIPWLVPDKPLAPMAVPIPKPVRLPGFAFPPDIHNPDADGYSDPETRYRRKPKPVTNPVNSNEPVQARRPKRKEKERKVTGSNKHLKFLGWILSQYSEIGDLVDALHSALPETLQVDGPMNAKLKTLYQHWDKVDMTQAVQNMVEDMVTDPKWAGVFEEMQQRQEEWGLDLGGLKGLEGSSGIWPTIR